MRHAYLIIAHKNFDQLIKLISLLDYQYNDIYIHIDRKSKGYNTEKLISTAKESNIYISSIYNVYWGSFEIVQTELFLLKEATKRKYDYYHLISGLDLPIKSNKYIYDFFEKNNGYEFVHFDTDERLKSDKEIGRRTKLYHFLQNYRRRYKIQLINEIFTFIERFFSSSINTRCK